MKKIKINKGMSVLLASMLVAGSIVIGCDSDTDTTEDNTTTQEQQNNSTLTQEQQAFIQEKLKEKEAEGKVKEEAKPGDIMVIQGDDFSVKITNIETSGSNLTINYDYNNESNEDQTPIYKVAFRCYQDGVELDTSYSRDNYKDQDTILAGYSNEGLQDMFKIENKEAPVLIRVEPWVDFCDTILAEYEYTPSTGELVRK